LPVLAEMKMQSALMPDLQPLGLKGGNA